MKLRHTLLISTAISGVLGLSSVGIAIADDYDWTGFYAGVGVSVGRTTDGGKLDWFDPNSDIEDILTAFPIASHEPQPIFDDGVLDDFPGALEGAGIDLNAGYNVEVDNFLFGIEVGVLSGPLKSDATYTESGTLSYTTSSATTSYSYSTSTLYETGVSSVYTPTISTITTTSTFTTTVGLSTSTYPVTDSYSTFQTTTTNGVTTVEFPTSSLMTTSTSAFATTTLTSSVTGESVSTSTLGSSTTTYLAAGSWESNIVGRASIDWLSTVKGRVGFTADRTLFFATAGLAIGGVTQETSGTLTVTTDSSEDFTWSGSKSETRTGFVVGGGIEQALDDHWIVSGSAEYFSLGDVEYDVVSDDGLDTVGTAKQTLDGYNVNLGIKYKF